MAHTKPKIYVTRALPKLALDKIASFFDAEVWDGELPTPREVLLSKIRDVEGLICLLTDKIDAELFGNAKKLKAVSNMAVGYDNIDVSEATRRGILVCNTPWVLTETTAEFTFALLMAAARRVAEGDRQVRRGDWKTWGPMTLLGQDLNGATLGIIGLGRIGSAVARVAKSFRMKLLYNNPRRKMEIERELGIEFTGFNNLLGESDFVSIHTSLTPETHHLIGKPQFERMKPSAILINSARGPIVDNMALYEALRGQKIAYAALDVTDPEPLPSTHPLLTLDNIIVTPHIASATVATRGRMAMMAVDNLIACLNGEIPSHLVNPEALRKS